MNTFYFDDTDAFGSGVTTPDAGDYITIPENTTIKVTRYNISRNSYSGLTIPASSRLIFVEQNTQLYLNQAPVINGQVISAENSSVIVSQITGRLEYSFWHDLSSWNGGEIPQPGDDITIPDNTILVHRKKESNTLYTINALNELIKRLNGGVVDTKFPIDWQHYRNTVLLTQRDELKQLKTKIHKILEV